MQDKKNYSQLLLQLLLIILDVLIIVLILNIKITGQTEEPAVSLLTDNSYYTTHRLYEDELNQLQAQEYYLLYFRSDTCPACQDADEIVQTYLDKHYGQAVPVYFAEAENVVSMYEDEFYGIEVTPTMIYMEQDQLIAKAEGSEEIFELLDEIVRKVSS